METPVYNFSLDSFDISNTRARHNDTDFVTFSVKVGKGTTMVQTKSMGDVNNGLHPVGLAFNDVPVGSNQVAVVTYLIVNAGNANASAVVKGLENAATKIAAVAAGAEAANIVSDTELASAISAALGSLVGSAAGVEVGTLVGGIAGTILEPGIGTAVGALAAWAVGEIAGLITANCDGIVAAQVIPVFGSRLWSLTALGKATASTPNYGSDSPDGCGSNSEYTVNWSVTRAVRTTVSTLLDSAGQMHVFAVGENGHVYTAFANPGQNWDGWGTVSDGVFEQGTTVSTLLDSADQMHLFAVGENGRVYTTIAKPGQDWDTWRTVSDGVFTQGTTVSALLDKAGGMNLFAVGQDGLVYSTSVTPGQAWTPWLNVLAGTDATPNIVFTQGTAVTSLLCNGQIYIFAVGNDGHAYTYSPGLQFAMDGWVQVSTGVFSQGTTVTALLDDAGQMYLFATGEDGFVYMLPPCPGWSPPEAVWTQVPNGIFSQGTTVASLIDAQGEIHLFAVGENGYVSTVFANLGKPWIGWGKVPNGVFRQGTVCSALLDRSGEMHLFAVGENGRVYTAFAQPGQDWIGWGTVSDGVFAH